MCSENGLKREKQTKKAKIWAARFSQYEDTKYSIIPSISTYIVTRALFSSSTEKWLSMLWKIFLRNTKCPASITCATKCQYQLQVIQEHQNTTPSYSLRKQNKIQRNSKAMINDNGNSLDLIEKRTLYNCFKLPVKLYIEFKALLITNKKW